MQSELCAPSSRAAMASHRGIDGGHTSIGGQRWTAPADQLAATHGSRYGSSHHIGETLLGVKFDQSLSNSDLAQVNAPFSLAQSSFVSPHSEDLTYRAPHSTQIVSVASHSDQVSGTITNPHQQPKTTDAGNLPANHATTQVLVHYSVPA